MRLSFCCTLEARWQPWSNSDAVIAASTTGSSRVERNPIKSNFSFSPAINSDESRINPISKLAPPRWYVRHEDLPQDLPPLLESIAAAALPGPPRFLCPSSAPQLARYGLRAFRS